MLPETGKQNNPVVNSYNNNNRPWKGTVAAGHMKVCDCVGSEASELKKMLVCFSKENTVSKKVKAVS